MFEKRKKTKEMAFVKLASIIMDRMKDEEKGKKEASKVITKGLNKYTKMILKSVETVPIGKYSISVVVSLRGIADKLEKGFPQCQDLVEKIKGNSRLDIYKNDRKIIKLM